MSDASRGVHADLSHLRFPLVALSFVVVVACGVRLIGLSETGLGGNDTILYYSLAERWLQGDYAVSIGPSVEVHRPVLHAMNAAALWLFGHTDWSIKLLNVVLDTFSLLLIAGLAWQVSRRWSVVLATAVTYGALPIAIWASRQELAHSASIFFVTASSLLLVFGLRRSRQRSPVALLVLSGAALAAAIGTHEELGFLWLPMLLFVFAFLLVSSSASSALKASLAFSVLPLLAGGAIYASQRDTVQSVLRKAGSVDSGSGRHPLVSDEFFRFLWDVVLGAGSALLAMLVLLGALVWLYQLIRRPTGRTVDDMWWWGYCLLVPVAFVGLNSLLFSTIFSRAFLPVFPLLVIFVYSYLSLVLRPLPFQAAALTLCLFVIAVVLANMASYSAFAVGNRRYAATWAEPVWPSIESLQLGYMGFLVDARYRPSYYSHWRSLYRALQDNVDPGNRVLILPSTAMHAPGRRPLQTQVYFGDNAIYRLDHHDLDLATIVSRYNIRWIIFTTGQQRAVPKWLARYQYNGNWSVPELVDLAEAYRLPEYSVQAEANQLRDFLSGVGARDVSDFAAGSYEASASMIFELRHRRMLSE